MSRIDRTLRLADLYQTAADQLERAVAAIDAGDKALAVAAMEQVTATMSKIGEAIADGPILRPLISVH